MKKIRMTLDLEFEVQDYPEVRDVVRAVHGALQKIPGVTRIGTEATLEDLTITTIEGDR